MRTLSSLGGRRLRRYVGVAGFFVFLLPLLVFATSHENIMLGGATLSGTVTMPDGTPAANATVEVRNASFRTGVPTDSGGRYLIEHIPAGDYEAQAYPPQNVTGVMPSDILRITLVDGSTAEAHFGLRPADTSQPPPDGTQPPPGGTLTGTVMLPDGTGVKEAFVDVFSEGGNFRRGMQADANGNYSVPGIPPGTFTVQAYPPMGSSDIGQSEKTTVTFSGIETQTLNFTLKSFALNGPKVIQITIVRESGVRITDARAFANSPTTGQNTMTQTQTNGVFMLKVFGGSWWVNIEPVDPQTADWFSGKGQEVKFALNETSESTSLAFNVLTGGGTVRGLIRLPAGVPTPEFMGVGLRNQDGLEFHGPVQQDGSFLVRVAQGSYRMFIHSPDERFSAPEIPAFSVVDGETKDLGAITLIERTERIRGTVRASDGTPVAKARVNAFVEGKENHAFTVAQFDGRYELYVLPARWGVMAESPEGSAAFIGSGEPRSVEITAGAAVDGVDFTLRKAEATVSGSIVDANASFITDIFGFAFLMPQEGFGEHVSMGGPIRNGSFSFGALRGNWMVSAHFGPDSPYSPGPALPITIEPGEEVSVNLVALANNAVIAGTVRKPDGTPLSGVDAHVFAVNAMSGAWQDAFVDRTNGTYRLRVAGGSWALGLRVPPDSGYASLQPQRSLVVTAVPNGTVTQNLTVVAADAAVTGTVRASDGTLLPNVWVSADKLGFETMESEEAPPPPDEDFIFPPHENYGTQTDNNGQYRIALPSGTYFMHAFLPPSRGLISPPEQRADIASGQTVTVDLTFRVADARIEGQVVLGGAGTRAFVWAWSEQGGHSEAPAAEDGRFTLAVASGDRWHVGAVAKRGDEVFRSEEVVVDMTSDTATVTLELLATNMRVPEAGSRTIPASQPGVITLEDGMTFSAPANAFSTEGSVTVNVSPDVEVAPQGNNNFVGVTYEIEARDESGDAISDLNLEATLYIPIPEEVQQDLGVAPEQMTLMFLDETTGAWKELDKSVVDSEGDFISAATDHLTRFAVVAPADTTPPSAPSNIAAAAGNGAVIFSWVNPAADFHSARIYRSIVVGQLGDLVASNIQDTTYLLSGLQNGTAYYFTVRAVDLAGNESQNTAQVSATPSAEAGQVSATISTQLPSGSLFRIEGQATVWFVEAGQRRGFTSAEVFVSRFNWENVRIVVNASHLDLYVEAGPMVFPDGAVVKGSAPTVYVIADGKKLPVSSAEVFIGLGYQWGEIITVADSDLTLHANGTAIASTAQHPNGSLVKLADNPTVYYLQSGRKLGIPAATVFEARKFQWAALRTISADELAIYADGGVLLWPDYSLVKAGAPEVYFIDGGKKRHVATAEAFNAKNFQWDRILTISNELMAYIPQGTPIQ